MSVPQSRREKMSTQGIRRFSRGLCSTSGTEAGKPGDLPLLRHASFGWITAIALDRERQQDSKLEDGDFENRDLNMTGSD